MRSTLPGLYACGEVSGGAHGANRLSGNALTETQVFGAIAGCKAAEFALNRANTTIEIDQNQVDSVRERIRLMSGSDEGLCPFVLREQLQQLAWRQVGVIRDQKGLENALSTLKDWETSALPRIRIKTKTNVFNVELVKALEFENMLQVLKAITISALSRSESCGAHYRTDSIPDSSVPVRYVIQRNEQRMELSSVTVEADIV